jgi:phage protein U
MADVLLRLGEFGFSIDTAAHQQLQRRADYKWPGQHRMLVGEAKQWVGPGGETITLSGVILPHWRGGLKQLDTMREMARKGEPLPLVTGWGEFLGRWVIEAVDEAQSHITTRGAPLRQAFTLTLGFFLEDVQ